MPKPRRSKEPRNAHLLEFCEEEFRRYLHVSDPGFLYASLGTIAANCYKGFPVWLMLVGPSGCGKSNVLMAIAESKPDWFRVLSDASKSAFLSGTNKREKAADATGGLLCEIAEKDIRFLVFKEYGSVLDQRKEDYNAISAMQREIWDGTVHRAIGSDGGRVLDWQGKIGELAACTSRIDDVLAEEVERGVRWMLWRYPQSSGWQETMRAGEQTDPAEMRECLTAAVGNVIESARLEWGMDAPRELSERETVRITRLASFSAKLQGSIRRDKYHKNEVIELPGETYPTRLGPALVRIYLGMEHVGVAEEFRWQQVRKISMDTAPGLRIVLLSEYARRMQDGADPYKTDWDELSEKVRCGRAQVQRTMEDLALLGVLNRDLSKGQWHYFLTAETESELFV